MAVQVKIKGVNAEFAKANKELIEIVNTLQRSAALIALTELKTVTPVDTGRARGSWVLSKTGVVRDTKTSPVTVQILGPIPSGSIERLYITNGTPYIRQLNTGSSKQAPPRFIESTLSKYFEGISGSLKYS